MRSNVQRCLKGKKMKKVIGSIEKSVMGNRIKCFRKAKDDGEKLCADLGEKFYKSEGQNKIPDIAKR